MRLPVDPKLFCLFCPEPDKVEQYRKMRQQSLPPPIKVQRHSSGQWKVVDGSHRWFAAYLDGAEWIEAEIAVPVDGEA